MPLEPLDCNKKNQVTGVGEEVEKLETLFIVDKDVE